MWQDKRQLHVRNKQVIEQKALLEVDFKCLYFTNEIGYDIEIILGKGWKLVAEQKYFFRTE